MSIAPAKVSRMRKLGPKLHETSALNAPAILDRVWGCGRLVRRIAEPAYPHDGAGRDLPRPSRTNDGRSRAGAMLVVRASGGT
jgi:hypothetical protein